VTNLLKSGSDRAIWIKSVLIVGAIAALLLWGTRHVAPAAPRTSSSDVRVFLLTSTGGAERAFLERWAKLNDPGRIFGYRSSGAFAAELFPGKGKEAEPPVFSHRPASAFTPELTVPAYPVPRTGVRTAFSPVPLPVLAGHEMKKLPLAEGAVVYDETGQVRLSLTGLKGNTLHGPLMVRAERTIGGTEFRVVGPSGNDEFDRSALEELGRRVRQGGSFAGILTVWGGGKETR